jgi:hypothetical protein
VPPEVQRLGAERRLKRVDFHSGLPVLIVNGMVAGLWERKPTAKRVAIKVEPFIDLSARQRRLLEKAGADVGRTLMLEPSLEIGRVEARPHL